MQKTKLESANEERIDMLTGLNLATALFELRYSKYMDKNSLELFSKISSSVQKLQEKL